MYWFKVGVKRRMLSVFLHFYVCGVFSRSHTHLPSFFSLSWAQLAINVFAVYIRGWCSQCLVRTHDPLCLDGKHTVFILYIYSTFQSAASSEASHLGTQRDKNEARVSLSLVPSMSGKGVFTRERTCTFLFEHVCTRAILNQIMLFHKKFIMEQC